MTKTGDIYSRRVRIVLSIALKQEKLVHLWTLKLSIAQDA